MPKYNWYDSEDRFYTNNSFSDIREKINRGFQQVHGGRVEERQRVNGQPNGYRAISEAELQADRAMSEDKYVA